MSRFEAILSTQISAAPSLVRQWVLRLKLAAYLARRGDLPEARREILEARSHFSNGASAQITAHINFAEGMCEYFESGAMQALVKLRRSRAIASRCPPDDDLYALASAWLANAYRVLGQWSAMPEYLISAFPANTDTSAETRARVSIVLADSWSEVSDYTKADVWYRAARRFSLECGDDLTIGAAMYNRVAIRVFNIRVHEAMGRAVDLDDCHVAIEAASAENFSQYTRDHSMSWVFDLLAGQVLMLQGKYKEALEHLDSPTAKGLEREWPSVEVVRIADILRCKAALDLVRSVNECAETLKGVENLNKSVGAGDMAVALWSLSQACSAIGDDLSRSLVDRSHVAMSEHLVQRELEKHMLDEFLDQVSSRQSFMMLTQ